MKLLMHACCAPCSVECIDAFREQDFEVSTFWYNPNIHPYTEYDARREAFAEYMTEQKIPHFIDEQYGLRAFLEGMRATEGSRCDTCYTLRLERAAHFASEHGFNAYTTTLLISPYQAHDRIRSIGETMAKKYGITFAYLDVRPRFREGQRKARVSGLYMQKYCGCIFSEEERYQKKIDLAASRYEATMHEL